jgi:hypothetical protein
MRKNQDLAKIGDCIPDCVILGFDGIINGRQEAEAEPGMDGIPVIMIA